MKILIVGGYGTFGGRLAYLLAEEERLTLVIAGRSIAQADAFCNQLPPGARRSPLVYDRNGNVEEQIRDIHPDLVVDASGPFQSYGEDPYRLVKACIANAVDYMDLADGSDFVRNISQFDEQAKSKNISILSGVSSFPVLTAAVVRRLSQDLTQINTIRAGIAPSPYAGVGLNVIRAIATYAGKRLPVRRNKEQSHAYALTETMRYTIGPPGYIPLWNTLFSLVDVPDLRVLPELWPEVDSVWMGAGPVPEILHRMLIGLAWLVRIGLLPSLAPFAPLFHSVINHVRWGEHRGGMFVSIEGCDRNGKRSERSWHLLAEGDHGPLIPSMAVEALVRRSLSGQKPVPGARPATRDLELEDYETIFRTRTIYTGQREKTEGAEPEPLYQQLLGSAWDSLPGPIKKLHGSQRAEGRATVQTGRNLLVRLAAKLIGLRAGQDIPVRMSFQRKNGGEHWKRNFGGASFSSFQSAGQGLSEKLLSEQFGLFTLGFAPVVEPGKLSLVVRRWSMLGIPLPLLFAPRGIFSESVSEDGRFCFHVEISHPFSGLIVRYQGWLVPSD